MILFDNMIQMPSDTNLKSKSLKIKTFVFAFTMSNA